MTLWRNRPRHNPPDLWLLLPLATLSCGPPLPAMQDGVYAVRNSAPKGSCPPAALWSLDDTFAEPDLLVITEEGRRAATVRRASSRNDTQLYEVEHLTLDRLVLSARDTTWCGTVVDRWELSVNKGGGYGGTRSLQLRVPPRCERLCTATVSTLVRELADPNPAAAPARFAGWTAPLATAAPKTTPVPVATQSTPVRFERAGGAPIDYLILGAVGGTWGLVSASPRWLGDPNGKTRGALTIDDIGAGRPVRTLDGRSGRVRGVALRTVPSSWTDNPAMTAYDVSLDAHAPADVAVVAGLGQVTWEPLAPQALTLSETDAAAIEVELPWTNTVEGEAEGEGAPAKRVFPGIVPLALGQAADGTRWLTVRQGQEPAGKGWLGVSLLRGAKDGTWSRWARFDVLVTHAAPAAVLTTPTGPAVISVGTCRNSAYPAYAVSTSDHTDELALDCGV